MVRSQIQRLIHALRGYSPGRPEPALHRPDLLPAVMLRALVASLFMAALLVPVSFSVAALIFTGPIAQFATLGGGMMMFGTSALCLLLALTSSYRGAIACPQDIPAVVLGAMAVSVTTSMAGAPAESMFITVTALLMISSMFTGFAFLAIGYFRLSNLFRFIPFAVTGGFFAGSGWVVVLVAFKLMTGTGMDLQTLPRLLESAMLWKWMPGAGYGLLLVLVMKRGTSVATLFWSLATVTLVYHLVLFLLGISPEDARAAGLLLAEFPDSGLWPAFSPGDFVQVDWGLVIRQIPDLLIVTMITLLCVIVYANGLEVATGVEMDLDKELRATGLAGIVAGSGGSSPGCYAFVLSMATKAMGAYTRLTGVLTALWVSLALLFGGAALELIPNAVIGGMLFFFGINLMRTWLITVRDKVRWTDYCIILLITATIAIFGFVVGFAAGLFATLTLFAIRLAQLDPVSEIATGRILHSNLNRSVPDQAILLDEGERIRVIRLRGYVFFGSAFRLVSRLKEETKKAPAPSSIVIDCTLVLDMDISATNLLGAYLQAVLLGGVELVICTPSQRLRSNLIHGLPHEVQNKIKFEKDLDRGLEWCEDRMIASVTRNLARSPWDARGDLLKRVSQDLEGHLNRQVVFEELIHQANPWMERRIYEAGETLVALGETHAGMEFIVAGKLTAYDAQGRRLTEFVPGNVIARQAAFGAYAAPTGIVAEERCESFLLTATGIQVLEATEPQLCLRLYQYVITDRSGARMVKNLF